MNEIKYDDLIKALQTCATGECYQVSGADGFPACGCDGISGQAADAIIALIARAEKAEAERDAAVKDMTIIGNVDAYNYVGGCYVCKHNERNFEGYGHSGCDFYHCKFEWRGKEQTNAE